MILWTIQGQFCEQKRRGRLAPSFFSAGLLFGFRFGDDNGQGFGVGAVPIPLAGECDGGLTGGKALQFQLV